MTLLRDADAHPLRFLAQIQDITDRRRSEEQLIHLADHDPLTGLLNRRSFEPTRSASAAQGALRRRGRGDRARPRPLQVHQRHARPHAGDEAIFTAAEVLRSRLRGTDVLARLGGDEFAVAAPERRRTGSAPGGRGAARRARAETVSRPHARTLTASAGIALFDRDGS